MEDVIIADAARTPTAGFQGVFSSVGAVELGGAAIDGALKDAGAVPRNVQELLMGCVLPAGQGQAPARQAGLAAGLAASVPATTVNKMCGSGEKTTMQGFDQIVLGSIDVIVAGGMESMANEPYLLLPNQRGGARIGHAQVLDSVVLEGFDDAYDKGRLVGSFAEDCAEKYQFTRPAQDEYAIRSLERAKTAQASGAFSMEISAVTVAGRNGDTVVVEDEQPGNARPEKIPNLKPAFRGSGTITAADASSISDWEAALVLASRGAGLKLRARILGHASRAQAPGWSTTSLAPAAQKLLEVINWSKDGVDLWELDEAFAVVPMAFVQEMNLVPEIVNVNGGAYALGHPIGASGTRIIVTLLNAMETLGLKRGIAAICIGSGEGTAIAIGRV